MFLTGEAGLRGTSASIKGSGSGGGGTGFLVSFSGALAFLTTGDGAGV